MSNSIVIGTNKGIVINQYSTKVTYCTDFILHHLCMLISLKISKFEITQREMF